MRQGAAFWGSIWYFQCYFPPSRPFPRVLFVLLALPLGLGGGFRLLMGPYGGTVRCAGSAPLSDTQPSPQQPAHLMGPFAKQHRNYHPAELLMHPKEAPWRPG